MDQAPVRVLKSTRVIMRIDVAACVPTQLAALGQRLGMTNVSMISRMIEFFAAAPAGLQALILQAKTVEECELIERLIWKEMAKL